MNVVSARLNAIDRNSTDVPAHTKRDEEASSAEREETPFIAERDCSMEETETTSEVNTVCSSSASCTPSASTRSVMVISLGGVTVMVPDSSTLTPFPWLMADVMWRQGMSIHPQLSLSTAMPDVGDAV